ncbi:MAG: response regulator [Candidatus Omnitrophota bacterium]
MWKILVVDDNFANRQLMVEVLREAAVCDIATNGREAFEAYQISQEKKNYYDLVLLDIAMPGVDGLAFLNMVREVEKMAKVRVGEGLPIIMVTAFDKPFVRAFNAGCDDYILKPIDPGQLLHKIKMKLQGRS